MNTIKAKTSTGEEVSLKFAENAGSGKGKSFLQEALQMIQQDKDSIETCTELSGLEKSLIALAEQELDGIVIEGQEGRHEAALQRYHAVKTLVSLLDFDDCGLSPIAAQVLLRIGVHADKAVAPLSIASLAESFGAVAATPGFANYVADCYAKQAGKSPTPSQWNDIKQAVVVMGQIPPSERTLGNFILSLQDREIASAITPLIERAKGQANFFQPN